MKDKLSRADIASLHSEYEKEYALLERGAEIEERKASRQRKHEWWIMITEKLWITVLVLMVSAVATFYGNILVEKYKDDNNVRRTKLTTARAASEDVWKKLLQFERSLDDYSYDIQQLRRDRDVAVLKENIPEDTSKVHEDEDVLKKAFSDVSATLDNRKIDLQSELYPLYRNELIELSLLRTIYQSRMTSIEAGKDANYFGVDIEKSTRDRVGREEQAILTMQQTLY